MDNQSCPFCGSFEIWESCKMHLENTRAVYRILCRQCGGKGPPVVVDDCTGPNDNPGQCYADAWMFWNHRPPSEVRPNTGGKQ